jgi:hypothetical protein
VQVKIYGLKHTYRYVNTSTDAMASNKWVAERVVDLLRDSPTMGTKELQVQLKKKKIEVPYSKVFRRKEKALDMLNRKWDDRQFAAHF